MATLKETCVCGARIQYETSLSIDDKDRTRILKDFRENHLHTMIGKPDIRNVNIVESPSWTELKPSVGFKA